MKKHLLLLSLLFLTSGAILGDAPVTAPAAVDPASKIIKVLQDPETKVVYYLESDLRHVAAISPDGKLLWCCEVLPAVNDKSKVIESHITGFSLEQGKYKDFIGFYFGPFTGFAFIDKKTGVIASAGQN